MFFRFLARPALCLPAFLLAGLWPFVAPAQVNTDSLWQVWTDPVQADTHRLNALQALAWSFLYSRPDSTATLATRQLEFSQDHGWKKWQAKAWNTLGATRQLRGDYAGAVNDYMRSLALFRELDNRMGQSSIFNNLGLIYRNQGDLTGALDYYLESLRIVESVRDTDGIATSYNNIGTVYSDQGNYLRALEYFNKALDIQERKNDRTAMSIAYNNIGSIYNQQGEYLLASDYYARSLAIRHETNDRLGMAIVYGNMGLNAKDSGKFADARTYYRKAMAIQEELAEKPGLASSSYFLGDLAIEEGHFAEAIPWCRKSLETSREIGALRLERNACHCLYRAYKSHHNPGEALTWYEQYKRLDDSMQVDETARRLEQMEFNWAIATDSLAREEDRLRMALAYQEEVRGKSRLANILIISILIILVLALAFRRKMVHFRRHSQFFRDRAELLEKQHLLNEIALLRTQVNPHFLFNSLSILSSLVRVDPDLSEKFIDQLSRSYRYILEQKEQELVLLRTEMDFIQSYIFLLKIRFERKFDVRFDIREADLDRYRIPPLTLQLLIENAMKHNRMSVREPLIVDIRLTGDAVLEVRNPLQPRHTAAHSTGIGLQNIITRYALLTEKPVWAGEREDFFVVEIPLIEA